MRSSRACTVSSVSISNPTEMAGKDFTNRREKQRYPERTSQNRLRKIRATIVVRKAFPNRCPVRYAPASEETRAPLTMSSCSSSSLSTMAGAAEAS